MDLIDGVGLRERAQRVELMAPAGSWEALTGALQGGADSVFFGVGKLNMRSGSAGNFSLEDMRGVAEEAHGGGAKCYLTVNTVVYEDELLEVRHLVGAAVEAGVDAVIASDQAVVEMARDVDVERIQAFFIKRGVWIRPFGKNIYIMPHFTASRDEIIALCEAIREAILAGEY